MTGQSRKHSVLEAVANVVIGYGIALASQVVIFAGFGIPVSFQQNVLMGLIFTVVSLVRSYSLRRFFNWLHQRGAS